jgi:hypothetical protein
MTAPEEPAEMKAQRVFARLFAWTANPQTPNAILFTLILICAGLAAFDFVYDRHVFFPFEATKGFYGLFGFTAFVVIVQAARVLRLLVMRPEDYYDR